MKGQILETTTCKWCHGMYVNSGACPKYGLKFRGSPCVGGDMIVKYKIVKVRNGNPWYKFWLPLYDDEKRIIW